MNFAALLIVIELDDFLMASPTQMQCKQFFGDDYLSYEFSREEIQTIAYKGLPIKQFASDTDDPDQKLTCGEKTMFILEYLISFVFKFMVVLIIVLVNIQIIEKFSVEANVTRNLKKVFKEDDGSSNFELDYPSELIEYH